MQKEEVEKIIQNKKANIFKINHTKGSYTFDKNKISINFFEAHFCIYNQNKSHFNFIYENIQTIELDLNCEKHNVKMEIDHEGVYHCQECIDDNDLKRILNKRNLVAITITEYRDFTRDFRQ